MKHYPIMLVVDFQFTIKPFSLSWPRYRIVLPFVVHFSPRSTEPTRRSSEKRSPIRGVFYLSPRSTKTAERSSENNLGPSPPSFRRCQHEHDPTTENGSSGNAKGS